ncbi:MAG: hypothetical protein II977_05795 [Oscillospiraceae bacterium]|nr:hypothetical protein [Oscillospiraceae bacterium]
MKKTVLSAVALLAALIVAAFIGVYEAPEKPGEGGTDYTLPQSNYDADPWYETAEYDGYTVTKHMTMGSPSILVEFTRNDTPVSVTITRGSKTTLVYSADGFSYDMYLSYKNDTYIIKEDFANMDEIVSLAFDWSGDSYMGTYSEEMTTDEDGNIVQIDENGDTVVYRYSDEIE